MNAQPSLYWSVSQQIEKPVNFTLVYRDFKRGTKPLVDTEIPSPKDGGIYTVNLADYKISLEPEVEYQWSLSIIMDSSQQSASQDIVSSGTIKLASTQLSSKIAAKLTKADESQLPFVYAEEGLWFDAIDSLSDQIAKNANNQELHQQRADLLAQVGLKVEKNGSNKEIVVESTPVTANLSS
jgi:hypothetical protein